MEKDRKKSYEGFISSRKALTYETRANIPNYEKRPKPLQYQHPLSPEESFKIHSSSGGLEAAAIRLRATNRKSYRVWPGMKGGRLWAAETVDYPNEIKAERKGDDKIKILEDTNGDGPMR